MEPNGKPLLRQSTGDISSNAQKTEISENKGKLLVVLLKVLLLEIRLVSWVGKKELNCWFGIFTMVTWQINGRKFSQSIPLLTHNFLNQISQHFIGIRASKINSTNKIQKSFRDWQDIWNKINWISYFSTWAITLNLRRVENGKKSNTQYS